MQLIDYLRFTPPKDLHKLVWLYTITGVFVQGYWTGYPGEHFLGWCDKLPTKRTE